MNKFLVISILNILSTCLWCQERISGMNISLEAYHLENAEKVISFAVKGDEARIKQHADVHYKYRHGEWHHILCSSSTVVEMLQSGLVTKIYFNPGKPELLNDTMRIVQNIDSVHSGDSPLPGPYTGLDVIMGYVDTGIDFNHPDFKNADGSTRVLYYWDQTLGFDPDQTPIYGYGQVWDSTDINGGTCTSLDNNAHGTTVSGTGSGNGLATGTNKGVAPDCDIIAIESNFSDPNWTLTVADAIDFVFRMADTLGKPAVVNTSVGDYLGSHDGTDPAGEFIDSLLNAKPGRIVVASAGNSGNQGKYHVKATVDADTSFCWFIVNPSSGFGGDAVFFDLWADTADFSGVQFAMAADNSSPFDFRGRTAFYNILPILDVTTYDSIMVAGNKLAPVEFYCEEINGVYHVQGLINNPDSNLYLYRFETFGSGEYDLWSGAWMGFSDIKSAGLPDAGTFPDIAHYNMPDTLSTTVSSWTCLSSVVTVGNFQNQWDYLSYTGSPYSSGVIPGKLSVNSSKGPNRLGEVKPDVSATGDLILSACPLWLTPTLIGSNPAMLSPEGFHVRNGGTSMASPVIAGIAALYLEKCPQATFQNFIDDLHAVAHEDAFTGSTPNMAYGHGKVDAFDLLTGTNFAVQVSGDSVICSDPEIYSAIPGPYSSYEWQTGETTATISLTLADTVHVTVIDMEGCKAASDTLYVINGEIPEFPLINEIGGGLITVPADSFIWYFNGAAITGSNTQFFDPDTTGNYSVEVFSEDGCSLISDELFVDYSMIEELSKNEFIILPNPFYDEFHIIKSDFYEIDIVLTDIAGRLVYDNYDIDSEQLFISVALPEIPSGVYVLSLYYENSFKTFRLVKN
jgi:hypothetical protein